MSSLYESWGCLFTYKYMLWINATFLTAASQTGSSASLLMKPLSLLHINEWIHHKLTKDFPMNKCMRFFHSAIGELFWDFSEYFIIIARSWLQNHHKYRVKDFVLSFSILIQGWILGLTAQSTLKIHCISASIDGIKQLLLETIRTITHHNI